MDDESKSVRLLMVAWLLIQVTLIFSKLGGGITWSWLWILAPTWVPAVIMCFFLVLIGAALVILFFFLGVIEYRRQKTIKEARNRQGRGR